MDAFFGYTYFFNSIISNSNITLPCLETLYHRQPIRFGRFERWRAASDRDLKMAKRRSKIVYAPKSRRRSSGTDRSQSASSYEQDTKETSRRNKRPGANNEAAEAAASNLSSNVENSQQYSNSKVQCQIKHLNWGFLFAIFGHIKSASLSHSLIWQSSVVQVLQYRMLWWFSVIPGLNFFLLLFLGMVMYNNKFKTKENKIKPRVKLNHNIYMTEQFVNFH